MHKLQIDAALLNLQNNEYSCVGEYLENGYTNDFTGTLYDLHGQGVPLIFPIDQRQVSQAVQLDSKISNSLYTRMGEDVVKQWDSTLDGRTRDTHKRLDGQIKEIDEPFEIGGLSAMCPGDFGDPAEDCNCRCCMLQRAKWALDESELKELQDRAEYFGLDKTKDFEDFKNKYLNAVENLRDSGIIKSLDVDDYELVTYGKNIGDDVNRTIIESLKLCENEGGFTISEVSASSISNTPNGIPVLQIEPLSNGLLKININTDVLSGKTLKEVNQMFANSQNTVVNSLQEAIIHESGHAKSIFGKSLKDIQDFYEELSKIHVEGISKIAYSDGAEALAELEVLRHRGAEVSEEAIEFYEKYMGRRYK